MDIGKESPYFMRGSQLFGDSKMNRNFELLECSKCGEPTEWCPDDFMDEQGHVTSYDHVLCTTCERESKERESFIDFFMQNNKTQVTLSRDEVGTVYDFIQDNYDGILSP